MNEEFQFKNWGYKDLGMLGAYIVEKNNESYKQIDVTNVKQYIKDLIEENQQYREVIDRARVLVNNVYNSLENADKPIKFYEELLDILNINERN